MTERDAILADLQGFGVPAAVANGLDLDQLRAVAQHEQRHREAGDLVKRLSASKAAIVADMAAEAEAGKTTEEIYAELLRLSSAEKPH